MDLLGRTITEADQKQFHREYSLVKLPALIADKCPNIGQRGFADGWLTPVLTGERARYISDVLLPHLQDHFIDIDSVAVTHTESLPLNMAVTFTAERRNAIRSSQLWLDANDPDEQVTGSFRPGDRVVLLKCVSTTGKSSVKAAELIRQMKGNIIGVVSVVDMEQGATEALAAIDVPLRPLFTFAQIKNIREGRAAHEAEFQASRNQLRFKDDLSPA